MFIKRLGSLIVAVAVMCGFTVCYALEDEQGENPPSGSPVSDVTESETEHKPEGFPAESVDDPLPVPEDTESAETGENSLPDDASHIEDDSVSDSGIDDEFGQVIEEYDPDYPPDYMDSGYRDPTIPPMEENVYAIRRYIEFILFLFIPLVAAVAVVVLFCIWFYRTFVRF